MKDTLYIQIIINYVESAKAFRENTDAVSSYEGSPLEPEFEALWQARDDIFNRWHNAAETLRELPPEYMAQAVAEIEKI